MANEGGSSGLSKKEQKKLAKKEAKLVAKQQQNQNTSATKVEEETATAVPLPEPPTWYIINGKGTDRATIATIWACQAFNVPIKAASKQQVKSIIDTNSMINQSHAALVLMNSNNNTNNNTCITGGGNAMVHAIVGGSSSNNKGQYYFIQECQIDEWCEWERTNLRHSNDHVNALEYLEETFKQHGHASPSHLVGNNITVADICIATTLLLDNNVDETLLNKYPHVNVFLKAHESAFQNAIQYIKDDLLVVSSSSSSDMKGLMDETSLLKVADAVFRFVITDLFGTDNVTLPKQIVKVPQNLKFGDIQMSAAMPLFSSLKKSGSTKYKSAMDVANEIINAFSDDNPYITDLQTQGSGFILGKFTSTYLQYHVNKFLETQKLPMPKHIIEQNKQKQHICVVDFSSPNIAKEMHVGHLRSTIIGESVCRILENAGYYVHRVNHVGDWGTQFGMLIQFLKEEYPEVTKTKDDNVDLPNITDLTVFYKNAKQRFDEDPDFKKKSQINVVDLQSGNPECMKIWKMLCDISRHEFEKVYKRLDVTCTEFGESYYNDKIPPVIDEFTNANKISIEEGGAKCVFVDKYKIPLMLQKSDGGYGYDSTDMAALKYRLYELKADRIIVITDYSQSDHFKMIYSAGHDIGWITNNQKLEHIGFGTVQGEDGKRFKTRSGDTVRLVDLLDEAVNRMENELRKRIEDGSNVNISLDEVHEVAEAIGYGAVKYFDLRRNPTSNYKFNYDDMLDTKGDTAVYLLYARARLESIIDKVAKEQNILIGDLLNNKIEILITHPSERNLVLQLQQYTDMMELTLDDLYPYHICEYVYKLATAASDFVTQCRVLHSNEVTSRVLLCYITTLAMHQCFDLLGIRHVKRI